MSAIPNDIKLYSMMICPFAQRTRIHLELKNIPFELVDLDICAPRPDWFLKLNPNGQVPVLTSGDEIVSDSSIVSEYVEERFPSPLPFGTDLADRARIRSLIKFVDTQFVPALYMLLAASTPEQRDQQIANTEDKWRWLNTYLSEREYTSGFIGEDFGLAEISIAPFFLRYEVVSYYQDFEPPTGPGFELVEAWRTAILNHPIVRRTAESTTDLIKLYEDYTIGSYNGAVPDGKEHSSLDLAFPLDERSLPEKAASVR